MHPSPRFSVGSFVLGRTSLGARMVAGEQVRLLRQKMADGQTQGICACASGEAALREAVAVARHAPLAGGTRQSVSRELLEWFLDPSYER